MQTYAEPSMRGRPGRPRHSGRAPLLSPREQILDAAGKLFAHQGYVATSTREIAESVGIRQASLYYHFENGKEELLDELLQRSIRPTTEKVAQIEALCPPHEPATVLYLLLLVDIRTLAEAPNNAGFLARLPEVTTQPAFSIYRHMRDELGDSYARLGSNVAAPDRASQDVGPIGRELGEVLLQLVEVVTTMRRSGTQISETTAASIAGSALRICGATLQQIEAAAAAAESLVESL